MTSLGTCSVLKNLHYPFFPRFSQFPLLPLRKVCLYFPHSCLWCSGRQIRSPLWLFFSRLNKCSSLTISSAHLYPFTALYLSGKCYFSTVLSRKYLLFFCFFAFKSCVSYAAAVAKTQKHCWREFAGTHSYHFPPHVMHYQQKQALL